MTLEEISAHIEIRQAMARYCRGIDRGDRAMILSAYHPDALDERGYFRGTAAELAEAVVPRMDQSGLVGQHHVTNWLIELDGDVARVEAYYIAWNPEPASVTGKPAASMVRGRYLDRFERRDGKWKIAHRRVVLDHADPLPDGSEWPRLRQFNLGGRGSADLSHDFFSPGF